MMAALNLFLQLLNLIFVREMGDMHIVEFMVDLMVELVFDFFNLKV